ncbi:MAG TPA: hypothetical protein PL009_05515 [Flavipsychrobacter sp.]|nr:hypothetical protein [Flavipsychrobacter sp.]
MNATPLTQELYNELKQENYKYLIFKRTDENKEEGIYEPVKELPNHFVIRMNSFDDEAIKASLQEEKILVDY